MTCLNMRYASILDISKPSGKRSTMLTTATAAHWWTGVKLRTGIIKHNRPPVQVTFVRSHFADIVSGEEKAGLPELPQDVIQSLLSSEELETQSEDDILEVRTLWRSTSHCSTRQHSDFGMPTAPALGVDGKVFGKAGNEVYMHKVQQWRWHCLFTVPSLLQAVLLWWAADPRSRSAELPCLLSSIRWKPKQIQV